MNNEKVWYKTNCNENKVEEVLFLNKDEVAEIFNSEEILKRGYYCEEIKLVVDIETVSQLQHELLVRAGMPITTEPIDSDGINVTFRVTTEVGQEYHTLLAFAIDEYKDIIAQWVNHYERD
jgi:hypothetical protein